MLEGLEMETIGEKMHATYSSKVAVLSFTEFHCCVKKHAGLADVGNLLEISVKVRIY